MKRSFILAGLMSLLIGCSSVENNSAEQEKPAAQTNEETAKNSTNQITEDTNQKYSNSPQATNDQTVLEVGQLYEDENGIITLKAIHNKPETYTVGPIELTVKDVKVLNYSPPADLIDYFHGFTHEEGNFNYVKVRVQVKNTSDQPMKFSPVGLVETNEGETIDGQEDFYLENLSGEYAQGEVKEGNLGFVIDKTTADNIQSIKLITSDVLDSKNKEINVATEIKVEF